MNMQKRKPAPKKDPDAIIILVSDGQMHMFGAFKNGSDWTYSKWVYLPESELGRFTKEMIDMGFSMLDVRDMANQHTPGMGEATPILLHRPTITLRDAIDAYDRVLQVILREE